MRTMTKAVWTLCALCLSQSSTRFSAQAAPMPAKVPGKTSRHKMAPQNVAANQKVADEKESRVRLSRLAQAALQASHQTDDKFRFSNRNYAAKIQSLLPQSAPLFAKSAVPPRFNDKLANISIHAIEDPQNVVLFYEGQSQNLDFRHNGWAVVALADGSVRSVTPSQAQSLRWNWNRVLDAQESDFKNGVDLSSPEKTARLFINALNEGRFDLARRCIAGVDAARATNAALPGWNAQRFALDVSKFEPRQLSPTIAIAQYQVKVGATPFFDGGMTAFVFDKGWHIAPAPVNSSGAASAVSPGTDSVSAEEAASSPVMASVAANGASTPVLSAPDAAYRPIVKASANLASRQAGTLSLLAAALLNSTTFSLNDVMASTTNNLQTIGANRLKSIGLGAMQFSQDYDEKIDFGPDDFREKLKPYMKNDDAFNSPLTGRPYAMNPGLAHSTLAQLAEPANTVLFFDGRNGRLNFSADGTAAILFADGHVKYVTPAEAANLTWTLPPMPATDPEAEANTDVPNAASTDTVAPNAGETSPPVPLLAPELVAPDFIETP